MNDVERRNGVRVYNESHINTLNLIECLKNAGLHIEEIKYYMNLSKRGNATLKEREELILNSEERIKNQLKSLQKSLELIEYKKWYYKKAKELNSEEKVKNSNVSSFPKEIQDLYFKTHYKNKED